MKENKPFTHILLADDDKDHVIVFSHILRDIDPSIKLSAVYNGDDLLQFLSANKVDMVFLDLKMPCKTGHECLKEIRKEDNFKDLPIIMYSNSAYLADIEKCFNEKADFYMVKPFSSTHLKNALVSLLSANWNEKSSMKHQYFMNNRFVPYTAKV